MSDRFAPSRPPGDPHDQSRPSVEHLDDLEARLEALGRGLVKDAAARAEPGPAFLGALDRRAHVHAARRWTPRLMIAAAAAIAAVTVFMAWPRPAPQRGVSSIAEAELSDAPTLANLNVLNRDREAGEPLRLSTGAADTVNRTTGVEPAAPLRPADARTPQRIDAIIADH